MLYGATPFPYIIFTIYIYISSTPYPVSFPLFIVFYMPTVHVNYQQTIKNWRNTVFVPHLCLIEAYIFIFAKFILYMCLNVPHFLRHKFTLDII